MKKLEGRVAIVTGASSGVGRGLAKVLAENGAKICACARRVEKLEELKAEVEGFGGEVLPVACDVTDVEQINHVVVQCVERLRRHRYPHQLRPGRHAVPRDQRRGRGLHSGSLRERPARFHDVHEGVLPLLGRRAVAGASSTSPPPRPVTTATRASAPTAWPRRPSAPSPATAANEWGSLRHHAVNVFLPIIATDFFRETRSRGVAEPGVENPAGLYRYHRKGLCPAHRAARQRRGRLLYRPVLHGRRWHPQAPVGLPRGCSGRGTEAFQRRRGAHTAGCAPSPLVRAGRRHREALRSRGRQGS